MVALVLADAFLQKFGGDALVEMKRNFDNYARHNRRVLKSPQSRRAGKPFPPARQHLSDRQYGNSILEKPTTPIKKFDAELEQLSEDMFASMYAAQGVGLAAPQIGLKICDSLWWM